MTLQKLIQDTPAFKRVVLIGKDERIKHIYENTGDIPYHFLNMRVYEHILRKDGDLDVKLNI